MLSPSRLRLTSRTPLPQVKFNRTRSANAPYHPVRPIDSGCLRGRTSHPLSHRFESIERSTRIDGTDHRHPVSANDDLQGLMLEIAGYDDFTSDNDPYSEHDFGALLWGGEMIFWKIDCYDQKFKYLSTDPKDPSITRRVMTVMLAEEY